MGQTRTRLASRKVGRQAGPQAVSQISWLYRATTLPSNVLHTLAWLQLLCLSEELGNIRASAIWWCGHFRKLSTPLFFFFFFPQISSGGGLFSGFLVVRRNLSTRSEARVSNRWISSKAREKSSETKVDTVVALDERRAWSDRRKLGEGLLFLPLTHSGSRCHTNRGNGVRVSLCFPPSKLSTTRIRFFF